jgi:hypothetical protein
MSDGISKFHFAAGLVLSGTLCAAIAVSAHGVSSEAILSVLAIIFACLITGWAVLSLLALRLPMSAQFPAEILLGAAAISASMLLICIVLRTSAGNAFLLSAVVCLGIAALAGARRKSYPVDNISDPMRLIPIVTTVICGVSLVWSWQAIRSFPRLRSQGIFFAWSDFFIHSSIIAQFAHFSALNGTSMFSHGDRVPLYHWASYMLPAVVCSVSDTPALVVTTTIWVLFGYILMALGAWALGAILADWIGGAIGVGMLLLLPSAAHYGFRNPFFDFPWIVQISAALSYGVGLGLLTIGLCIVGLRHRSAHAVGAAAALALAEANFKVHLFVTLVPACSFFVVMLWQWSQPRLRLFGLISLGALAVLLAAAAEAVERAPHFFSGPHDVGKIVSLMLTMEPGAAPGLFPKIAASSPTLVAIPSGVFLLLLEAFGALFPAYLLAWGYCHRRGLSRREDCFPLIMVATYCAVVVSFPTIAFTGSLEEYQHRNFVLVYSVLAVWCGYFAARLVNYWCSRHAAFVFATCACLMLPVPFLLERTAQTATMAWSKADANNPVPIGLLQISLYLRKAASQRDIILASDGNVEGVLLSISERPALLALAPSYAQGLGYTSESIAHRMAVGEQLRRARTYDEMLRIARGQSIDWYLATPTAPLAADIKSKAAMCVGGYCVLHFGGGSGA